MFAATSSLSTLPRSTDSTERYVAIACQSVGIGPNGHLSMLARVSVVDYRGNVLLDTLVQPTALVVDYRSARTGLTASHLYDTRTMTFAQVQATVANFVRGKIVVGYKLWKDLSVGLAPIIYLLHIWAQRAGQILGIAHPAIDTRDVALFMPFRLALGSPNETVSLPKMMRSLMRRGIREKYQHPLEDVRASVDLYRSHEEEWEGVIHRGNWPCALPPPSFAEFFL